MFIEQLEARLADDTGLAVSVRVNTPQSARLTFDQGATDKVQDLIDSNFKFYKRITESPDFARFLFDVPFDRYLKRARTTGDETSGPVRTLAAQADQIEVSLKASLQVITYAIYLYLARLLRVRTPPVR